MAIEFTNIPIPWNEPGSMPSEELQTNGFKAGDKPSAQTFNALLHNTSACLTELQNHTSELETDVTTLDNTKANADLTNVNNTVLAEKAASAGGTGFKVGKDLTGQTVSIAYDGTTETKVTAAVCAEIFNDYAERTSYDYMGGTHNRYYPSAGNVASGEYSHAEGRKTTARGVNGHAEGDRTTASGGNSHAEGWATIASGPASHAQGQATVACGDHGAHAGGFHTIANNAQLVHGKYNKSSAGPTGPESTTGDIFIMGNGTSEDQRSNAFRVTTAGKAYGLSNFSGSGAGVAELYEWKDGNPDNEDRRGLFVTLDGDKIRIASPEDDYILGAIDPCPYVVGDVQSEIWKDMYLKDVFGEKLVETVDVEEMTDESGHVTPAHTEKRWVLNPEYDPTQEYVSRDDRSEFVAITSKGKVVMIDDGSCQVNKYCTVGENGIATASENNYAVRVMERIDDTHIRVYIDSVFINKKS